MRCSGQMDAWIDAHSLPAQPGRGVLQQHRCCRNLVVQTEASGHKSDSRASGAGLVTSDYVVLQCAASSIGCWILLHSTSCLALSAAEDGKQEQ